MKKVLLVTIFAALMMISSAAVAQTASGTLTVTATVNGSIQLIFNSDAAGVALAGTGTNAATLAFGNVSAFGAVAGGIVRTTTATTFTVSSAVDVQVSKTNSASANYTLKAQLGAADAVNTWQVGGVAVTSAAQSTLTATGTYAANSNFPVAITVPFTTASGTVISNTINYSATAN
ncbi:MAG TPA: hypothetical protein VH724_20790 [Candidatus Angelobacter sp.]|jgi:hypothetical protein|nr:hypothetical protein [Candidatus Angelobacter sp.]